MTDDAIGGLPDLPPISAERDISLLAVVTQLDRIEARQAAVEGQCMAHTKVSADHTTILSELVANTSWVVNTVTMLQKIAETLPGVGQMMRGK